MSQHPTSAKKTNIAAYNGARDWGGGEIAQVALLGGLARRGHRVVLHCNHDSIAREAQARGLETRISYLGGDALLHHAWRLARELREQQTDVLLLGFYKKNFLAALAGRLARVPRVVARIETQSSPPKAKYRFVLKNWVDTIVTVSDSIRRVYIDAGYDPERVITIYNAFELTSPMRSAEDVRRSLGVPEGAPLVGAIGRLVQQKRFDRLIRAMTHLADDVHCVIAGEGEKRRDLEELAVRIGVSGRVHLPGWRQDVPDLLGALDVLVVSSDLEGLAIVMTEALGAGVPVVSTPVSGAVETLSGDSGEVVPGLIVGFDARELAEAIGSLLADPDRRRAMGNAGQALIKRRFSFDGMLDRWEAVLSGSREASPEAAG